MGVHALCIDDMGKGMLCPEQEYAEYEDSIENINSCAYATKYGGLGLFSSPQAKWMHSTIHIHISWILLSSVEGNLIHITHWDQTLAALYSQNRARSHLGDWFLLNIKSVPVVLLIN